MFTCVLGHYFASTTFACPYSPRGLCGRKATLNLKLNARGRTKHEPSNHKWKSGSPLKTQTDIKKERKSKN